MQFLSNGLTAFLNSNNPLTELIFSCPKLSKLARFAAPKLQSDLPKILLYSHDTFGLGNIRRTLLLAENFKVQYPDSSILILTGSPMIHSYRIPEGIDYVKLPCLDRTKAEVYEPRYLPDCNDELLKIRSSLIEKTVISFAPDLMVVDKRPAGIDGELLETLASIRRRRLPTKLVVGIRDILDAPEKTRESLRRKGCFETIEEFYDEVWIYGSKDIFDTAVEYGFPEEVKKKTIYCGYLKRPTRPGRIGFGLPKVLVTSGSGADGCELIKNYLEGLDKFSFSKKFDSTIVFGPQMAEHCRTNARHTYKNLPNLTFLDFEDDMTRFYAEADVVVSMAGYNTVCELLSFRKNAVLLPRAEPVREQLMRASLFAAKGLFDYLAPWNLSPENLFEKINKSLSKGPLTLEAFDFDGLERINERVESLLQEAA